MKILFFLLTLLPMAVALCPNGYTFYNMTQKCYKVVELAAPYFTALEGCSQDGSSLLSIHNAFENSFVSSLLPKNGPLDHWIGMTNMLSGYDFEWLDNSIVNYVNWGPNQPNYDASCVLMKAGTFMWTSQTCRYFLPFICEFDPAAVRNTCPTTSTCPACPTQPLTVEKTCPTVPACPTSGTQPPKPVCDAGWKYFSPMGSCYFFGTEHVNNTDAQALCRKQGAYLPSIHSAAENSFIFDYVNSTTAPWIGLYRTGPNPGNFVNFDGTPVDYTNWGGGQPDNFSNNQYCTYMMMSSSVKAGYWDDDNCAKVIGRYVCKKPANKQ